MLKTKFFHKHLQKRNPNTAVLISVCHYTAMICVFFTPFICSEEPTELEKEGNAEDVEVKINGELLSKSYIKNGLGEINDYAPEVCPTEMPAAFQKRRERLISLVIMRQFLEKEKIVVSDEDVNQKIEQMKLEKNPFDRHPPKPLAHVMVRECIAWDDLKLMIRTDKGLQLWAERELLRRWPDDAAWKKYCQDERKTLEENFGAFLRISFSINNWPKGAKTEDEAMERLKASAEEAKKRVESGEDFKKIARESLGQDANDPIPAVLPFTILGEDNVERLKTLEPGAVSDPLRSPFSWELWQRTALTDEQLSRVLRDKFIFQAKMAAQQRLLKEAKLEEVNWTKFDEY
jgi:hypothetical protein